MSNNCKTNRKNERHFSTTKIQHHHLRPLIFYLKKKKKIYLNRARTKNVPFIEKTLQFFSCFLFDGNYLI